MLHDEHQQGCGPPPSPVAGIHVRGLCSQTVWKASNVKALGFCVTLSFWLQWSMIADLQQSAAEQDPVGGYRELLHVSYKHQTTRKTNKTAPRRCYPDPIGPAAGLIIPTLQHFCVGSLWYRHTCCCLQRWNSDSWLCHFAHSITPGRYLARHKNAVSIIFKGDKTPWTCLNSEGRTRSLLKTLVLVAL